MVFYETVIGLFASHYIPDMFLLITSILHQ